MDRKEFLRKTKKVVKTIINVNKYLVVLALGVLLVGFIGDNSVVSHLQKKQYINELKAEIARNENITKANTEQIARLKQDKKAVEKVAREHFFMKMDDEDVFVLSDDSTAPESPAESNETVE